MCSTVSSSAPCESRLPPGPLPWQKVGFFLSAPALPISLFPLLFETAPRKRAGQLHLPPTNQATDPSGEDKGSNAHQQHQFHLAPPVACEEFLMGDQQKDHKKGRHQDLAPHLLKLEARPSARFLAHLLSVFDQGFRFHHSPFICASSITHAASNTCTRAYRLSLPATSVHGHSFVDVNPTMSLIASS